jgi:hypothetical protein
MVGGSFGRPQVLQSLSNSAVFKSARSLLGSVAHLGIVMPPDTHHLPACGYDATHVWESEGGFSVCRLVRDRGIVPIPRSLPCYRAAPSLWRNQAWLAVGKRVVAAGSFAPGTDVLGQPGDVFDGEMRGQVDILLFLMEPSYVAAQFESLGLPSHRAELHDLPARPDPGLLDMGCRLANALAHGLSGDELYCEVLLEAMLTRIVIRHATVTSGRMPHREILTPRSCAR